MYCRGSASILLAASLNSHHVCGNTTSTPTRCAPTSMTSQSDQERGILLEQALDGIDRLTDDDVNVPHRLGVRFSAMNSTYFGLLAEFGEATVPLDRVAPKYFGLSFEEARRRAPSKLLGCFASRTRPVRNLLSLSAFRRRQISAWRFAEWIANSKMSFIGIIARLSRHTKNSRSRTSSSGVGRRSGPVRATGSYMVDEHRGG